MPLNPLFEQGYTSIGCAPCTRPVLAGEDERAGRWAGRDKTECGIHTAFNDPAATSSPPRPLGLCGSRNDEGEPASGRAAPLREADRRSVQLIGKSCCIFIARPMSPAIFSLPLMNAICGSACRSPCRGSRWPTW
jgi:hypothetical protein